MNRHLATTGVLACTIALLLGTATAVHAFPEPAIVSPSWNLEFQWQQPEPIAIQGIDGSIRWFWYMPYTVTNNTGQDILFIPEITVASDTGQILPAGQNAPASLFSKIKAEVGSPLLESPIDIVGTLLQGPDFARQSVAIWPAFAENVDEITVFVGGLSGETRTIANPLTGDPILMRRTHMLRFSLPGAPLSPQDQPIVALEQRDVMR